MVRSQAYVRVMLAVAGCITGCATAATSSVAPTKTPPPRVAEREPAPIEAAPCDGIDLDLGRLHVSQRWNVAKHKCIVMVSSEGRGGKARSYLFNSEGMLMTFSVLGKGPVSRATGARTHLLLPNVQKLHVESSSTKILVHTTSGHIVTFDGMSGEPEGISDGEYKVEKTPSARNGGGVELRVDSGIVVDFGFARGGSPHENPEGSATVSDGRGQECTVKNRELLSYAGAEPSVAVSSAAQLSAFFAKAQGASCGSLTLAAR